MQWCLLEVTSSLCGHCKVQACVLIHSKGPFKGKLPLNGACKQGSPTPEHQAVNVRVGIQVCVVLTSFQEPPLFLHSCEI